MEESRSEARVAAVDRPVNARGRIKWRVRKTQSLFTKGIKFHFIKARFESGYTALCKKYDCEYDY